LLLLHLLVVAVVATGWVQAVQAEAAVAVAETLREQSMVVAQELVDKEMLAAQDVQAELTLAEVAAEQEQQVAQLALAGTAMAEMDYQVVLQALL
jgi:hypothetical protein